MNILFLDDSPDRAEKFLATYPHAVWVQTAAECIEKLRGGLWHEVCLDHDLGGESMVDSNREDCGAEVVRWILMNRPFIKRVIVHTWNEPAGRRMVADLHRREYNAVYAPFGSDAWK